MQHHESHYATVSEAINKLSEKGFTTDFRFEEKAILCDEKQISPEQLEIVDVYRYEGDSDPADEATVYAIESQQGHKGVLVTGYGASADDIFAKLLAKIKIKTS